ncbi:MULTISPECIES: bifunctional 2-polyprenyl-6-hydroxyphenol methylase/3-demethylubiquinol 3-O-methyltransferase UbiG [Sorangium]|uniref:SAM-dependent methyltransferase n=1 Tax=Sorangium cellulosum TaxID=56 RepID=A0A4P2QSS5_SORCE|nr:MULTISPECIES: class I SAM-dependent methyltransferase [Sorangium]AUX33397.1 SAM-dependent methyltransferase [Sorangium cellulosum]WCQ92713.1 tRNA methyltransferase [Sorangium sp. Soce836]
MKRATRIERLVDYYEDFAPDYVSTWKDIQHYEKPVRAFLREAVPEGGRVLDAGCGPGHLTRDLPPSVDVVGFDIAERMLEIARKKRPHGAYHRHDYHAPIPRSWGRFDVALALGTLEFCDDLALVLKNLAGALRSGGRMLVSIVERRPHVRMHERAARPLSDVELSGVSMYLYTFAEQTDAILRAGLLPRSYRLHPGWRHTEYDVDVLYALWDLEASSGGR